jgi:guanylate kinase
MADPVYLHHKAEFIAAIADHRVSDNAQAVLDSTKLVVLSGIAGGGRNTIINYLVEHYNYFFIVSDTTRPPKFRNGALEQNGVHYYFRTEEDMLRDIQNGEFIEAEVIHDQQVSGTSIRELKRARDSGKIAIHDFEYQGAQNVAAAKPDTYVIGLLPPSYDEWIERLTGREDMHSDEFLNRLATAEKVLEAMLSLPFFRLVVNDTLEDCAQKIRAIVEEGADDTNEQAHCHQVATDILARVKRELGH